MAILITVHGTGAGDDSNSGQRWWQLGSPFLTELGKRLDLDPSQIEIKPFQWGHGPNSEEGRRDAGRALYLMLKRYDQAGEDYYLLGHSHGGSVIYSALLHSIARRKPLERLKSWTTVGTPFLEFGPNRWLYQRLGNMGLTVYLTALTALILVAAVALFVLGNFSPMFNSGGGDINAAIGLLFFFIPAVPYGLVCLAGLYVLDRVSDGWYSKRQKQKCADRYSDRWLGLWHANDEAISALVNVKHVSGGIVPSSFLVPFFALLPLLLTLAFSLFALTDILIYERGIVGNLILTVTDLAGKLQLFDNWGLEMSLVGNAVLGFAALVLGYIGVTYVATLLLKDFARRIGKPLSSIINRVIWSSIRQRAWGDDRLKEGVVAAGSRPPQFASGFPSLPEGIATPLAEHSEKHAILTLTKVREVLGMAGKPQSSPNMMSELSDNLNWRELIHTSYFEVPEFIDLVAHALHRAGIAELREDYWKEADRGQTSARYDAIRAGAPDDQVR